MLMVFFGFRLFGRTDRVPGAFFIATEFFHVMLFPLFPVRSWLVVEPMSRDRLDGQEWSGRRLPLNMKSVLLGWARAWLALATIFTSVGWLDEAGKRNGEGPGRAVAALLFAALFTATMIAFRRGSFERARALLEKCELPDSVAQKVKVAFGRPVPGVWRGRFPSDARPSAPRPSAPGRAQVL